MDRFASLHTRAQTDQELLKVWSERATLMARHTLFFFFFFRPGGRWRRSAHGHGGGRAGGAGGDARTKEDGSAVKPATVNTYVAAVKSFLGFAHRVGFTRFNAAPLIKLKKAPRLIAQRILSEVEVAMLIRGGRLGRDRLMLEVAYFGGLRVSELVSLTWGQ